jgi:hypothetical protein
MSKPNHHRLRAERDYIGDLVPDEIAYSLVYERLMANSVRRASGCLEWTGFHDQCGYGKTAFRRKATMTHRLMYVIKKGPLTDEQVVRHTCDNPPCMEPDHLIAGTEADNTKDSIERDRHYNDSQTHCWRGHSLAENAYIGVSGSRHCRICQRIRTRMAAGWSEYDAITIPKCPPGYRPPHVTIVTPLKRRPKESSHCTNGHELSGNNLYVSPRGYHECKICRHEARKRFHKKSITGATSGASRAD